MKHDELYTIAEGISERARLIYANKRRQINGLAPMTPEEEKAYLGTTDTKTNKEAYIINKPDNLGKSLYKAFKHRKLKEDEFLASNHTMALLIYRLYEAGYRAFYMNQYAMTSIDTPIVFTKLSDGRVNNYMIEARDIINH